MSGSGTSERNNGRRTEGSAPPSNPPPPPSIPSRRQLNKAPPPSNPPRRWSSPLPPSPAVESNSFDVDCPSPSPALTSRLPLHCLKELAATRKLSEILTVEEAATYGVTTENCAQVLEGEPHPDGVDKYANPESIGLTETENSAKYVSIGEEMYKKAKEYESKIIVFELAIRRPYFLVKPLDNPELGIGTATLISLREKMTLIRYMLNAHPLRCSTHHLLSNVQHFPSSSSPVYSTAQPLCSSSSSPVYTCRRRPLRYSSSSAPASSPVSLDRVVLMYFSFFLK